MKFLGTLPGWAVAGGVALLAVALIGVGGYVFVSHQAHVNVASNAQDCISGSTKLPSLFSDGQTTMIRLSNPDYSDMRILRTEPANVLPGMFDSLLSLSNDNSKLAYVTASDELLDDAHIQTIDVSNPGTATDLAAIPKGLWTTTPSWSQDGKKLAFVRVDSTTTPAGFQLWIADTRTQPATVAEQTDLVADNFINGHSASICWTKNNGVVLVPAEAHALPSPSPTSASAKPTASASPATGSQCGVPIYSQNDPAWQAAVMKSGSDTIGGAGCALTATAMLLNYYGSALSPPQLNSCLGTLADPIDWKAVPNCTGGIVTGGDRLDFTWTDLDALLASGRPAIVGMLRGQTGSHFVVVTSGGGGLAQSYHITDPWDATTFKTLGSYIDTGYNPTWIISYSGPGHNCGRLIKGVVPVLSGFGDGQTGQVPVTVHLPPNIKNLKLSEVLKLSGGLIDTNSINTPFNPVKLTDGMTFTDDGIYQVIVVTQAPSQPPVVQIETFTIDHTAPTVDLSLLNPRSFGATAAQAPAPAAEPASLASSKYPGIDKPGQVEVVTGDTLSGVKGIKTSLDGGPLVDYSSDTTLTHVLVVATSGDHSLRILSTDAAGNLKDVTKYFTVFGAVPSPSPKPTPPKCTTSLKLTSFAATAPSETPGTNQVTITVTWLASGACSPYSGSIAGFYTNPATGGKVNLPSHNISSLGGTVKDQITCNQQYPEFSVTYNLALADSASPKHQISGSTVATMVCHVP
jgi:Peptidase_C39 like family/WD40-like Beta Propeller Repeat